VDNAAVGNKQNAPHNTIERGVFFYMKNLKTRENLRALSESALLVALGFILSYFTLFPLPQGGSVTPLSMLPILMIGLRHGLKWGLSGGFVFAGLQMLQQFWPPPTGTLEGYIAVVMLDYIFAFTVLGLSGLFSGKQYGLLFATPLCLILRFISHFISGIVVWNVFADELPIWLYSLTYNGSYMGIELVLTFIAGVALCRAAPVLFNVPNAKLSSETTASSTD